MEGNVYHSKNFTTNETINDLHQDTFSKTILGFWIYLMTDCILFATFFTTYAVLHDGTFGGPGAKELFSLPLVFTETMILLLSSLTCGMALLAAIKSDKRKILILLGCTFVLGFSFLLLELHEFKTLIDEGNSFSRNAFLSSFFTLVGTHGLHVFFGLVWLVVLFFQIIIKGFNTITFRRLVVFNMFWHFLDLIWIFIFTLVYLMGVI